MLQKIKKYRLLLLIIFIILFYFLLNSNVYASVHTSAGEYPDFPSPINSENYDIILINHGSWTYNDHMVAVPKNSGYFYREGGIVTFKNTSSSAVTIYYYDFDTRSDIRSYKLYRTYNVNPNTTRNWSELGVDTPEEGNINTDNKRHIIYTNTILYSDVNKTSIYYNCVTFPNWHIEYDETSLSYWIYSDWYPVKEYFNKGYSFTPFAHFGKATFEDFDNLQTWDKSWDIDVQSFLKNGEDGEENKYERFGFKISSFGTYTIIVKAGLNLDERHIYYIDFNEKDYSNAIPFYLEYNNTTNTYFVYSRWYSAYDMHNIFNFYKFNPDVEQYNFDFNLRESQGWLSMEGEENHNGGCELRNEWSTNVEDWRDTYEIIDYGTYYFCSYNNLTYSNTIMKFVISENGDSYFQIYDKDDLWVVDKNYINDNDYSYINSDDIFKIYLIEAPQIPTIYTNYFNKNSEYNFVVKYSTDNVNFIDDNLIKEENGNHYRYLLDVTSNGTYYFKLYKYKDNELISTTTLSIDVFCIGNFFDDNNSVISQIQANAFYKFFKVNLGALFYPIDLLFDFLSRLDNIDTVEPNITVPTIREYFTDTVIINGFTFNLEDILQNETFSYIYTIYLNFVDFILFIALINYMYKVCKDFINFGGGII